MKYAYTGALVTLAASATAQAQEVTIDLTGIGSWDSPGSASNIILTEALPAGSIVSGVTWTDVTGSGLGGPSWGNEMSMNINGEVDVQFFPAEGSGSAGGNWGPASGSAAANFADELVIEFYEGYDDGPAPLTPSTPAARSRVRTAPLPTATATALMMPVNLIQPPTVTATASWTSVKAWPTVMPMVSLMFAKVAEFLTTTLLAQLPLTSMADWPQGLLLVQLKKTLGPVMLNSLLEPDPTSSTASLFLKRAN